MSALSAGQRRLWFLQRLDPADASYNMPVALRIRGRLDEAALEAALTAITLRHDVLRGRYAEDDDGNPVRLVTPAGPALERIETGDPLAAVAERANRPFDLAAGPVARFTLIEVGPDDHVLCLVVHHIAADGWSVDVLLRELDVLYRGGALPPLPITFADHVARGDRSHPGYWAEELRCLPVLDLPGDRPRATGQGGQIFAALPPELVGGLEALARRERGTLFMVLLAAFQVFLARHAAQHDVCVAVPVLGRDRVDTEPLVGYFTGLAMLRTDLGDDPPFTEALRRARGAVVRSFDHGPVPDGVPGGVRFQAMFQYTRTTTERPRLGDLDVEIYDSGLASAKCDLSLDVYQGPTETGLVLTYDKGRFDRATAERFAARFRVLLDDVAAHPHRSCGDLDLFCALDTRPVGSHVETPPPEIDPASPAVACDGVELTYGELGERVARMASGLVARGVRPGDVVGVSLRRNLDLVPVLLAVWRAGAAYLPVDPGLPAARVSTLLSDGGARILVGGAGFVPGIAAVRPGDLSGPFLTEISDNSLPAYVLYTSGSTGLPKGVVIDRQSVSERVSWMRTAYDLQPGDRVAQFSELGFDAHVEEIFPSLEAGATVVMLPNGGRTLPDFLTTSEGARVTVLDLPTSFWHALVEEIDEIAWPPNLRLVILGGDPVAASAVKRWRSRFGDRIRLVNTYGPTEATVIATAADLGAGRPSIGRPVAGTTVAVLDPSGREVPPGVPGELAIGGAGVAWGYLNRPRLTAERFVPAPNGRLYLTGDRARVRADGDLEFLGRLDDQVKIRGVRIEPAEVEAALTAFPSVRSAAVIALDGSLVAYVTGDPDRDGLRAHLRRTLPEHLVPGHIVPLPELPLTRNGKLDRTALPAPGTAGEAYVAPRTDAEELVAQIFGEVLGAPRVGATDDFFALGGHSLLATRVVARIRRAVDLVVPVRTLFASRTVAEFAAAVDEILEEAER
ncbi:amino acid adenylation domain-containing protein [Herbidospora galbida]|uniref:Amino acid adenylation domain-containing protein n=1 Tax=Herbidospora galbida TaxID=2575442 RepID=A0A4U3MJN0_9ACTN|nr:non-ribosomal peptide synthetase [Herbidospora galbida]TKK88782.1 amino acid adenylation domain-containing protein [Herbidospora galbida]